MTLSILDSAIIGGGLFGLLGIFFPEFLYNLANSPSETKYNKKDALKVRLWGVIILVFSIVFYIYDNYFR